MASANDTRSGRLRAIVPIGLALIAGVVVIGLIAVPEQGGTTPAVGGPSPSVPGNAPISTSSLRSNNARLGGIFHGAVHTRSQVLVWLAASLQPGPSMIGPFSTDLGPDWFVLQGPTWTGGGNLAGFQFPVPVDGAILGLDVHLQAAVCDPFTNTWFWTPGVTHRFSMAPNGGRSILLIRQVSAIAEAPHAPSQADLLAQVLQSVGHQVTIVDDAPPQRLADLAGFDALMDCRFTLPPGENEKGLFLGFLQNYGGVFLLSGPFAGSPGGQWRQLWIDEWVNGWLGLSIVFGSGMNQSNGAAEIVSPAAEPRYLLFPQPIQGLPYDVASEGGSFGPPGAVARGWPWIQGAGYPSLVYGMMFKPSDMSAVRVSGGVAILFNGSPEALISLSAPPPAGQVFINLASWLDV
jgi:hypothetical protein